MEKIAIHQIHISDFRKFPDKPGFKEKNDNVVGILISNTIVLGLVNSQ